MKEFDEYAVVYTTEKRKHEEYLQEEDKLQEYIMKVAMSPTEHFLIMQVDLENGEEWNTTPVFVISNWDDVYDRLYSVDSGAVLPTMEMFSASGDIRVHRTAFFAALYGADIDKVVDMLRNVAKNTPFKEANDTAVREQVILLATKMSKENFKWGVTT